MLSVDTSQSYYRYLAEVGNTLNKHDFVNGAYIADDIVNILSSMCGYDKSPNTLKWVVQESSIYTFMVALGSAAPNIYPAYRQAFKTVLQCGDLDSSIDKLRDYYKNQDF